MVSMIAFIISMVALAVSLLAAISGVLSDGLKGLKKRGKLMGIAFYIYVVSFLVFFTTQ